MANPCQDLHPHPESKPFLFVMLFTTRPLLILLLSLGLGAAAVAQTTALEARNETDASLLQLNTDAGFSVLGTADTGVIPTSGAGVRMMWFPGRYAFRAGQVSTFGSTYWDDANIGYGSAAFGENARASGDRSFSVGLATTASGDESVALGNNSTASADRALSFNGTASAVGAIALGSGAQCTGDDCVALGPSSIASGLASITIGPSIATGSFGIAIGLQNKASGMFSVAIGKNARTAGRQGSIVLGDGCAGFSSDSVYATANNQFVARGCGGIRFYTSQNLSAGVAVAPGGGSWSSISDRNRKEHFAAVDGEQVLKQLHSVPVMTWNYKTQDASIRHMGPMAQDFYAAFALGEDSLLINSMDIDGVNLAAIQALEQRTSQLQEENAALRARLDALEDNRNPLAAGIPAVAMLMLGLGGIGVFARRRATGPTR